MFVTQRHEHSYSSFLLVIATPTSRLSQFSAGQAHPDIHSRTKARCQTSGQYPSASSESIIFFTDCCQPPWAMTSGRCFPAAPQNRKNKIGRGFRNKSCLWSWQRQGHQTQVIPSKPVRRRHPYLGRPGPPQRPQRRGRVYGHSGTGDFLFHLRGRIRGHPWRADVVLFITRMDGTLFPQQHWQFRLNARHPLRHQNPGRAVARRPGGNRSDHPKEIFPVAKRAKGPPGIRLHLDATYGYHSPIGNPLWGAP